MTTSVTAYAATSATDPLTKTTIYRRDVGPHDVAFDIHFAGICHSDIHTVRAEWGEPRYPVVPGHEIAGVVTEVGATEWTSTPNFSYRTTPTSRCWPSTRH